MRIDNDGIWIDNEIDNGYEYEDKLIYYSIIDLIEVGFIS